MQKLRQALLGLMILFFCVPVSSAAGATLVHTVTFDENLMSGKSLLAFQASSQSTQLTYVQDLSPSFSNPGFGFNNWNTKPNGSGSTFANGQNFSFSTNMTLYAQWTAPFHAVTFNENRWLGDPKFTIQLANTSTPLTYFADLSPSFQNPGFVFVKWNTMANGSSVSFGDGAKFSFAASLTLFAQWKRIPTKQPSMVLIGVLGGRSKQNLSTIAASLVSMNVRNVEILQCGTHAPDGPSVASRLTRLLLGHANHVVNVAFRGFAGTTGPSETEIFARALMPTPH